MRVLLLAQWYEPVIGGEEIHVRSLAHALARRGHEVTVAALAHPDRPDDDQDGPVHVRRIRGALQRVPGLFSDRARQSAPSFPDPGLARGLGAIVRELRPDVVHAHNWIVFSYLPVKPHGTPLVLTLHDFSLTCATKVRLYRGEACDGPGPMKCLGCATRHYGIARGPITFAALWTMHPALRARLDAVISVSEAVARGNDVPRYATRHHVIPNFLDDAFAATPDASAPDGLPDRPFVMYAGSLSRIKGIGPLLEGYATLDPSTRPPLVLIGYRGHDRLPELDRLPDGARLVTDVPRAAVAAAWQRSLMGVVPSICLEAFGIVALEAMAFGRPVVASNIGGLGELVVDDETGLLVAPGSAPALAAAIDRIAGDDVLRARLGAGALRASARYGEGLVVAEIESVYRSVVQGDEPAEGTLTARVR
jgi:glycosyltransferase involved in cell wall biosynthesis